MTHDCQEIRLKLDIWPQLDAESRRQLSELVTGCAACQAELASAEQLVAVLEDGRKSYLDLRYQGPRPDFSAGLEAADGPQLSIPLGLDENRSKANSQRFGRNSRRWLSLAALVLVALGMRWALTTVVPAVVPAEDLTGLAGSSGNSGSGVAAREATVPEVALVLPSAPQKPATLTQSKLSTGALRRPTLPSGGRSLTFTSPPRPSIPVDRGLDTGESRTTDHRQGERS